METKSIDQLLRGDQSGTARRASTASGGSGFANLLDAQAARARAQSASMHPAELQGRGNEPSIKTMARPERSDDAGGTAPPWARRNADDRPARTDEKRADKDARTRDVRRTDDRPAPADRADDQANAPHEDDAPAASADDAAKPVDPAQAKTKASPAAPAKADAVASADPAPVDAAPAKAAAPEARDTEAKPAQAEQPALPVAADATAQTVAVPTVPNPVVVPVAVQIAVAADPAAAKADDAEGSEEAPAEGKSDKSRAGTLPEGANAAEAKPGEAKDAKVAATSQIALPTSTLAASQKAAAPATEEFADFMLRNAGTAQAAAGADAKDAAKADDDAPRIAVTVAQPMGAAPVAAPVAASTAFVVQAAVSNDNSALEAVKAAGERAAVAAPAAEGEDARPVAKDPLPAGAAFAQALDGAKAADAADAPKSPARAPVVPPHEQVAIQIRKAVSEGVDQISIRLNPGELGRIDVKLDVSSDGTLRASFAAEKHQTLELLKNDSRQLENSLQQAGLKADAGGLNFSLRGDNRENAQAFRDMGGQSRGRSNTGEDGGDAAAPVASTAYPRRRAANGRVDLNA
jgi:flagellar hook-length control protein FliK